MTTMIADPRPTGVKGWLTAAEAAVLQRLAKDRIVLEIGAYHGLSTIVMAKVAKRVYSIDPHTGAARVGPENTLPVFLANLEKHGVRDKVVLLVGTTEDMWAVMDADRLSPFGFVFIDGSHETQDVCTDTLCAGALGTGSVAWHDWNERRVREGVAMAYGNKVPQVQTVDGLAWIE